MCASDTKRTSKISRRMSPIGGKADISRTLNELPRFIEKGLPGERLTVGLIKMPIL